MSTTGDRPEGEDGPEASDGVRQPTSARFRVPRGRAALTTAVIALVVLLAATATAVAVHQLRDHVSPAVPAGGVGPPPGNPIRGVDVSAHNEPLDWAAVAGSGVRFAMIKVSEGTTYLNPFYRNQIRDARGAGLAVGMYAFARPDGPDPKAQADAFADHAGYRRGPRSLTPMVDLEYGRIVHQPDCYGLRTKAMVRWIAAYLGELSRRFGIRPMIYTTADWWRTCTGGAAGFGGYPLAVASYGVQRPHLPPGWSRWAMWQYTDRAAVAGSTGPIDGDVLARRGRQAWSR